MVATPTAMDFTSEQPSTSLVFNTTLEHDIPNRNPDMGGYTGAGPCPRDARPLWSAAAYCVFAANLHICRPFHYPPPVDALDMGLDPTPHHVDIHIYKQHHNRKNEMFRKTR